MQTRFTPKVMQESYFETETEFYEWKKISDTCYFAIKTWNREDSNNLRNMHSRMLIIEYNDGRWNLEMHGVGESFSDTCDFYLFSLSGEREWLYKIFKVGSELAKTAVCFFVPFAGAFVASVDFLDSFQEIVLSTDSNGDMRIANEILSYTIDVITDELSDAGESQEAIADFISDRYTDLKIYVHSLVATQHKPELNESIGLLVSAIKKYDDIKLDAAKAKMAEISKALTGEINDEVRELAKEYSKWSTISQSLEKEMFVIDLFAVVTTTIVDFGGECGKYSGFDPFGSKDYKIGKFQQAARGKFNDNIVDSIPSVCRKIFNAYYGIDD